MSKQLRTFTVHSVGKATRKTHAGFEYAVYPVVMLVEGVHHGANTQPVFYPAEVIAHSAEDWNRKPVPVQHPQDDKGQYVLCNNPATSAAWSVGWLENVKCVAGKLKAEAWIQPNAADAKFPGLIDKLDAGEPMEVSTGLLAVDDGKPGKWNNEEFSATITEIIPDHLALLPNEVGACSWKDGCGIRTNVYKADDITLDGDEEVHDKHIHNNNMEDGKMADNKNTKGCCPEKVAAIIANEHSAFTDKDQEFLEALTDDQLDKIINSTVVVEVEAKPKPAAPQTLEQFLAAAPAELRPVLNAGMRELDAKRAALIATIVANANNKFTEDQLKAMDVQQLEGIAALAKTADEPVYFGNGSFQPQNLNGPEEAPYVPVTIFAKQ